MKPPRPALVRPLAAAALLLLAGAAAFAQEGDDTLVADTDLQVLPSDTLDHAVWATLLPDNDAADPTVVRSAISAVLAARDARPRSIVPITARKDKPVVVQVRIDPNAVIAPPTRLMFDSNQVVQIHADGMPAPNGPDRDPMVRVMPRQADPNAVTVGARWSTQDRIPAPLLSGLSWGAHADLVSGAVPARAGNVRRSLRITAMWDTPEDLSIGFTPGFTRGGGREFEHYVTGLEVSTVDKTKLARWKSYVEVSGEKLAFNNVIDNSTAHVAAGASYATSSSTQLDFNVSRGTTWTSNDLTSNVGLSVRF
ncbi:MAG: hypothetical protein JF585_08590 [Burkholderiales bacterium]|nr:hypothetical protein [Burkholderiales bacterium]